MKIAIRQKLIVLLCGLVIVNADCKKTNSERYEGNFEIRVNLLSPASAALVVDSDSTRVDLSFPTTLTWKISSAGNGSYFITARDNPNHSLYVNDGGGPSVAPLPASSDDRYHFYITPSGNNLVTIRSASTHKFLYVPYCEKNQETWAYDVNFVADTSICNANNPIADTCYCRFAFQLLGK